MYCNCNEIVFTYTLFCKENEMLAKITKAKRYDAGDKLGYLIANIEFALEHPQLQSELKHYLIQLQKRL